jgi:hypothetical protein
MSNNTDATLGGKTTTPVEEPDETLSGIRDVTPDDAHSETTFDFAAFVAGSRATRRAVTLYARGDLKANLDLLAEEYDLAEKVGDTKKVKDLREQAKTITAQMTADGAAIDVVVEGRSDDWLNRFNDALDKDKITDETERVLRRVAAQVIAPETVTYELLEQFRQISEPQVRKVVVAATMANQQPVSVDVPFLRGSSAARSGRGSSSR